jgi:hypothetical protein
MDEKAVAMVRWKCFTQLLQAPRCRGMRRHINVQKSAASVLDDNKDVKNAESGCDYDAEITRHDALGMIPDKGRPSLGLHALAGASV